LLVAGYIRIIKKKFGMGMLGFGLVLIMIAIVLLFQQYPRHGVISLFHTQFDIKQYAAIFVMIICLLVYRKWNKREQE
jgi:amino acid permease